MIYEVEFGEIESTLIMYQLDTEDIMAMPFDGSQPAKDSIEALERILWTLNACVTNLEEVKDSIKDSGASKQRSHSIILSMYQCCVALNPVVDMTLWNFMVRQGGLYHDLFSSRPLEPHMPSITTPEEAFGLDIFDEEDFMPPFLKMPSWVTDMSRPQSMEKFKGKGSGEEKVEHKPLDKKKILTLRAHLEANLIGQPEVIDEVVKTLRRSSAGLKDDKRPLGVFLFCGSSGTGKTHVAKLVQEHLFGKNTKLVRIDCGEYQQKHQTMSLTGSPNSYIGYEEGGQLTNAVKESQNTVLLLDEAEKAHPDFWNLFLKVFDEGYLTDNKGEHVSFENTIIIMTSNLGNDKIAASSYGKSAGFNANITDSYDSAKIPPRDYVVSETKAAINKFFKPELVNRIDDIIVFNYLTAEHMEKIAKLEFAKVATKLARQHYGLRWTKSAEKALAEKTTKSIQGARAMSKIRRSEIEDALADRILAEQPEAGTVFQIGISKEKETDKVNFVISKRKATPKVAATKIHTVI